MNSLNSPFYVPIPYGQTHNIGVRDTNTLTKTHTKARIQKLKATTHFLPRRFIQCISYVFLMVAYRFLFFSRYFP